MVSLAVREIILRHHQAGLSPIEISECTFVKSSTVSKIIRKWKVTGSISDRPRSGRPKSISKKLQFRISHQAKKQPYHPTMEIWQEVKPIGCEATPSKQTISRILKADGLQSFWAKRKPMLTGQHKKSRFRFCISYKNMDWNRVIFSDEKRFRLLPDGKRRVWRKRGEAESSKFTLESKKFGGGSVMVWVAIRSDGKIWVRRCSDHMDTTEYLFLIQDVFAGPDFYEVLSSRKWFLQQDNATVHTGNAVLELTQQIGLPTLPWPSMSPDLNIVEHVWPLINRHLPKRAFKTKDDLWKAIETTCGSLDGSDAIKQLFQTMPRRIQSCIDNKGGSTPY